MFEKLTKKILLSASFLSLLSLSLSLSVRAMENEEEPPKILKPSLFDKKALVTGRQYEYETKLLRILRTHSFSPRLFNLIELISLIQSVNPPICTVEEKKDLKKVKSSLSELNKDDIWHGYYTVDQSCDTEKQSIQSILDRCIPQITKKDIINWLLYYKDPCPTHNYAIGCALESILDVDSLKEEDKEKVFAALKENSIFSSNSSSKERSRLEKYFVYNTAIGTESLFAALQIPRAKIIEKLLVEDKLANLSELFHILLPAAVLTFPSLTLDPQNLEEWDEGANKGSSQNIELLGEDAFKYGYGRISLAIIDKYLQTFSPTEGMKPPSIALAFGAAYALRKDISIFTLDKNNKLFQVGSTRVLDPSESNSFNKYNLLFLNGQFFALLPTDAPLILKMYYDKMEEKVKKYREEDHEKHSLNNNDDLFFTEMDIKALQRKALDSEIQEETERQLMGIKSGAKYSFSHTFLRYKASPLDIFSPQNPMFSEENLKNKIRDETEQERVRSYLKNFKSSIPALDEDALFDIAQSLKLTLTTWQFNSNDISLSLRRQATAINALGTLDLLKDFKGNFQILLNTKADDEYKNFYEQVEVQQASGALHELNITKADPYIETTDVSSESMSSSSKASSLFPGFNSTFETDKGSSIPKGWVLYDGRVGRKGEERISKNPLEVEVIENGKIKIIGDMFNLYFALRELENFTGQKMRFSAEIKSTVPGTRLAYIGRRGNQINSAPHSNKEEGEVLSLVFAVDSDSMALNNLYFLGGRAKEGTPPYMEISNVTLELIGEND